MSYTAEQLAIVCPKCRAGRGGKCLDKTLWGSRYVEEPHSERVQAAEQEIGNEIAIASPVGGFRLVISLLIILAGIR